MNVTWCCTHIFGMQEKRRQVPSNDMTDHEKGNGSKM